jgi:hypothetical protein
MDDAYDITLSSPEDVPDYGHTIDITTKDGRDVVIEFPRYISYDVLDNTIIFKYSNKDILGDIHKMEKHIQELIYDNQTEWLDCHLTKMDIKSLTESPIKESDGYFTISCELTDDLLTGILSENRPVAHTIALDHILCKPNSFSIRYKLLSIIREIPEIRFQDKSQGSHDTVKEINIEPPSDSEILQLSTPSDIYKQMYKTEKSKAKEYRRSAIEAYLRAKDIKMRYIAKDIDISDDSDDEP